MKKIIFVLLVFSVLLMAADMPPELPASFYGEVTGVKSGVVSVRVDGLEVASADVFRWQGQLVYTVNVPMDGIQPGTMARFYVANRLVASMPLYGGTNTYLPLVVRSVFFNWFRR